MNEGSLVAQFLGDAQQQILVVGCRPRKPAGRCVLIVPPFAEEMNKSRRMCMELAQRLAARGIATVIPDFFGTGDSAGEFRDADWQRWRADLQRAAAWSADEGWPVTGLLGIRLGCLLAAELAADMPGIRVSVLWQPVLDGSRYLAQFLRLRVASSMMKDGAGESATELHNRLRGGEVLTVAGYELAPRLVEQIEAARLAEVAGAGLGAVHWIEVVRGPEGALPTPALKVVEALRARGVDVDTQLVSGEPFWAATEIVVLPELLEHTANVFSQAA